MSWMKAAAEAAKQVGERAAAAMRATAAAVATAVKWTAEKSWDGTKRVATDLQPYLRYGLVDGRDRVLADWGMSPDAPGTLGTPTIQAVHAEIEGAKDAQPVAAQPPEAEPAEPMTFEAFQIQQAQARGLDGDGKPPPPSQQQDHDGPEIG